MNGPRHQRIPSGVPRAPSTDIYFRSAIDALEGAEQLEPDAFALSTPLGDTVVIVRRCTPELARRVRSDPPDRLIVLMDDDLAAIVRDGTQPLSYRWRTWRAMRNGAWSLLPIADAVLVPSEPLVERMVDAGAGGRLLRIDPAMVDAAAPLDHHDAEGPFRIAMLDTRSHYGDVARIVPVIRDVLDERRDVRLTTFFGRRAPSALIHERAEHREPLEWPDFVRERRRLRAHLSLAPRDDTPLNAGRSATRLLDNAMIGAAGLYGHNPAIASALSAAAVPGWTYDIPADGWRRAIMRTVMDRKLTRDLAEAAAWRATTIGDPDRQRRFWLKLLYGDGGPDVDAR